MDAISMAWSGESRPFEVARRASKKRKLSTEESLGWGSQLRGCEISSPAMTNVLPFRRKHEQGSWEPSSRPLKTGKPQKRRKPRSQSRRRRIVLQVRNLFLAALVGGLITQYAMKNWLPNSHSIQQLAPFALASEIPK